jgi:flavorubredoxin
MGKVLIAYHHAGGTTEKMANYIGEGVRINGQEAVVKEIVDIKTADELAGYDGYILGSPTYSLDVPETMKKFLVMAQQAALDGKLGGTFGSYTHDVGYRHDNHAPAIIFRMLQDSLKMKPFELGPFNLTEDSVDTSEGLRACHEYGRIFGHKLAS